MTTSDAYLSARVKTELTVDDELLREQIRRAIRAHSTPVWLRLLQAPLLSVLVAGVLGAWLTHRYDVDRLNTENELIQRRSASERQLMSRQRELAEAYNTFESISGMLDKRYWRVRRVMWSSSANITDRERERRRAEYDSALTQWNEQLSPSLARVEFYFGTAMRRELQDSIARDFTVIHDHLVASRPVTSDLEERADQLARKIYDYDLRLLRMIQKGELSSVWSN